MVGGLIPYIYMCNLVVGLAKRSVGSIRKIEGDIEIFDDL